MWFCCQEGVLQVLYTRGSFKPFQCAKRAFCYFIQAYGKLVNIDHLIYFCDIRLYWGRVVTVRTRAAGMITGQYPCRNHGVVTVQQSQYSSHSHGEVGMSIARYVIVTIKVSLLKSKYVHVLRPCHANVIIILCYYQPLILV